MKVPTLPSASGVGATIAPAAIGLEDVPTRSELRAIFALRPRIDMAIARTDTAQMLREVVAGSGCSPKESCNRKTGLPKTETTGLMKIRSPEYI